MTGHEKNDSPQLEAARQKLEKTRAAHAPKPAPEPIGAPATKPTELQRKQFEDRAAELHAASTEYNRVVASLNAAKGKAKRDFSRGR